jgi:hypothetical protein
MTKSGGEPFVRGLTLAFLAAVIGLLVLGAVAAAAQDLEAGLANAEQKAAQLEAEIPSLQGQVSAAEARYRAATQRATPSLRALHSSQAEVQQLRRELAGQERKAKAHIAQLSEQHQQEVDDHDEEVRSGVGFGLAALVAGLIALFWGWFRSTAPLAALTQLDLGRAIGLCLGGGLLMLIVGAVLGSSDGAVGALGSFLFCLGLILPTALLLARHSIEVQRGESKPLLRRERLPNWVSLATAGLMLVLFLAGTGSAIFAGDAASQPISSSLEEEAEAAKGGRGADELAEAQEEVARANQRVASPLARRNSARRELASARRELGHAQQHLASARSSQRSFTQRLVALEAKEQRELEKEEARAQHEQEELEEEAEDELASECDPNYSGCLDPFSPDYDCEGGSGDGPDYTGTVEVLGVDHYGLDEDGDGIGCDP